MIEITKGNPTPEEIAALVAVLTLAGRTTQPRLASPRAGEWRRSTPFAESNSVEPNRRDRRWRTWTTGWSCVGPAHAPLPHRAAQRRDPNVADPGLDRSVETDADVLFLVPKGAHRGRPLTSAGLRSVFRCQFEPCDVACRYPHSLPHLRLADHDLPRVVDFVNWPGCK